MHAVDNVGILGAARFGLKRRTLDLLAVGLHLESVSMELPVRHAMEALKPTLRCLDGAVHTFGATDVNGPLQTLEWMPVGTEKILEEADLV